MSMHEASPERGRTPPPSLAWWKPWTALASVTFALQFAWEMLQAPLYANMTDVGPVEGSRICATAALGDVVITLLVYGAAAAVAGTRTWVLRPRPGIVAPYLALGIVVTAAIEVLAVYRIGRWSYGAAMPRVAGVGLAPLAQWVVVPILTLWLIRRWLKHRATRPPPGDHHG